MQKSADDARIAKELAEKLENRASTQWYVSIIGIVVALVAIVAGLFYSYYPILQLTQDSIKYMKNETVRLDKNNQELKEKIEILQRKLDKAIEANNIDSNKTVPILKMNKDNEAK